MMVVSSFVRTSIDVRSPVVGPRDEEGGGIGEGEGGRGGEKGWGGVGWATQPTLLVASRARGHQAAPETNFASLEPDMATHTSCPDLLQHLVCRFSTSSIYIAL